MPDNGDHGGVALRLVGVRGGRTLDVTRAGCSRLDAARRAVGNVATANDRRALDAFNGSDGGRVSRSVDRMTRGDGRPARRGRHRGAEPPARRPGGGDAAAAVSLLVAVPRPGRSRRSPSVPPCSPGWGRPPSSGPGWGCCSCRPGPPPPVVLLIAALVRRCCSPPASARWPRWARAGSPRSWPPGGPRRGPAGPAPGAARVPTTVRPPAFRRRLCAPCAHRREPIGASVLHAGFLAVVAGGSAAGSGRCAPSRSSPGGA